MSSPRKICVVTGSRADYGHLVPVMRAIDASEDLTLQIIACGEQLDPAFGECWKEIVSDGFTINAKADIGLESDTALATAEATGRAVTALAQSLDNLMPDIVMVLGDRYEIFAACVAAMLLRIPIAHIHGGEVTEAAMDDAMRHAMTKMSALHFVAAEPYAARVRQMGEDPQNIIVCGAPGLDHLPDLKFQSRTELSQQLDIELTEPLFVVTYHPVTLAGDYGAHAMSQLATALDLFPNASIIITGVNSDPGNKAIREIVAKICEDNPDKRTFAQSLGQRRYLSAVKIADAVIGNSSSGLIEAPALRTPTVNIGDRQKGRLRSPSVIDCGESSKEIAEAIQLAIEPSFKERVAVQSPAYGAGGGAAEKIVEVLASANLAQLSIKRFHDIIPAPKL